MSKLSDEFEWTPHIHNNGSREHVLAYGSLTERGGPTAIPVTWCSHPFCANNRDTIDFLEECGVDPLIAQPPPRLRIAISERRSAPS